MQEGNKKFKDTKVGKFLKEKAPGILNKVGDVLPNNGVLGIVKNLITNDVELTPQDKDCLLYTSPSPRDGLLSRMPSSA